MLGDYKGDILYEMQTDFDCGPRALCAALQIQYEVLKEKWGWRNYADFRDNFFDSHFHHFVVLQKLGIKFARKTLKQLLDGDCVNNKTLILLHDQKSPYLGQHWALLKMVTESEVFVYFGDKTVRIYQKSGFYKFVETGWPHIIYTVRDEENNSVPWYQRWYVKLIDLAFDVMEKAGWKK